MSKRAKLFRNGGSQAVRLPKSCRFDDGMEEVRVRREGRRVILEPVEEWPQEFLDVLGAWPEELERPQDIPLSRLRNPFR